MLLRYSFTNHLSIRDRQELSLSASRLDDASTATPFNSGAAAGILPGAVLYGPNASGKSNVIHALSFLKALALYSHSRGEAGADIPRKAFALDDVSRTTPSAFDIDFVCNKTRYHYGFEALDREFSKEWLYSFQNSRQQTLFERSGQAFRFGRTFKGRNRTIASLTRKNSLFLSAAIQNDHEEAGVIAGFLRSIDFVGVSASFAVDPNLAKDGLDPRIISFLKRIGTGVVGYRRSEDPPTKFITDLMESMTKLLKEHTNRQDIPAFDIPDWKIELEHQSKAKPVYFSLSWESTGTIRLLSILLNVFKSLDAGGVVVLDELDLHIHTQASEALLALFFDKNINKGQAQVIATTHDTNLLRPPILRRDQIWFAEKDATGATDLYPLSDFRTRKGDNIETGYLQGRYGAIPFAGSVDGLLAEV